MSRGTGQRCWQDLLGAVLVTVLLAMGLLALVLPTLIVLITSFDTRSFIGFPPAGFSLRRYGEILTSESILGSAGISLGVALATVALNLTLGVPAAIALARHRFAGRAALLAFLLSPIMLPGLVLGIAILMLYSKLGLSLSLPLLTLAHAVFTFPFVLRLTLARMERLDPALEEAALNLGASRWQAFRHVLLPQLSPGVLAGGAFAFLNSFDNLTVSLFLAPVRERTLPIELFYRMRFNLDPVVSAVAAFQFLFAFALVALLSRKLGARGLLESF